jgi:hypothetical protein
MKKINELGEKFSSLNIPLSSIWKKEEMKSNVKFVGWYNSLVVN